MALAPDEFQESDIIFQDSFGFSDGDADTICCITNYSGYQNSRSIEDFKRKKKSVPIDIPQIHCDNKFANEYDEGDRKIMPPHEILVRRMAGKMAFSICSEDERTLKGRRLWKIRDFILRLTGFIEA
ncbi:protein S40-1-like [Apium graveolens]|uniref:protein S40-1-like n=1 Tax=Apium graveolens TaxID=4045 RepID=UPI003D79F28D